MNAISHFQRHRIQWKQLPRDGSRFPAGPRGLPTKTKLLVLLSSLCEQSNRPDVRIWGRVPSCCRSPWPLNRLGPIGRPSHVLSLPLPAQLVPLLARPENKMVIALAILI